MSNMNIEDPNDIIISPIEIESSQSFDLPAFNLPDDNITFESVSSHVTEPYTENVTCAEIGNIDHENIARLTQVPFRHNTFHPLPKTGKGPVGNYYAEINWGNGFEQWSLVRFSTPMDNSCLFHAISNSFFAPYQTEILKDVHVPRNRMIAGLRKELAQKLAAKISPTPDENGYHPTYYDTLNGGNTSAFADAVPEFKLEYMQNQLESQVPIGYGYMEFIGNALNKDIYILEASRHEIYITDELPLTIKGNRNSIVLYYMNGHYELVGIQNVDGSFDTHFSPNHSLIRFLYDRVCQIVNQ